MDEPFKTHEKIILLIILAIIAVVFVGIGGQMFDRLRAPTVDKNTYQAVFFENNQPYFGHLKDVWSKHPYLTDIYYVKVEETADAEANEPQVTLVKFGDELHGPQDVMYFNWDKVLYWENLKPDSRIVKGILEEKAQAAAKITVPSAEAPAVVPGTD